MFARIYLLMLAPIWIPSSLMCFVNPDSVGNIFHVTSTTAAGMTELHALFGAIGVALGIQAFIAVIRPTIVIHPLITQAITAARATFFAMKTRRIPASAPFATA